MEKQPYPSHGSATGKAEAVGQRAERAKKLRNWLKDRPGDKPPASDIKMVAEALYKLLGRLEENHRIKKAEILRAANIGSEGDSTKHLAQYAIKVGASTDRLRKKIGPYYEIVKSAMSLAGLDEDETLLEVFGQASFWQVNGTAKATTEFDELADRLSIVLDGVAEARDLTRFFQRVKRGGGVLTPRDVDWRRENEADRPLPPAEIGVEFDLDPGRDRQRWPIEFYQPTEEAEDGMGDHIPVYPCLILGSWQLEAAFPVGVSADIGISDGTTRPVSGDVQGYNQVELRLCIVPIGKNLAATPALRVEISSALSRLTLADCGALATPSDAVPIIDFPWVGLPALQAGGSRIWGRLAGSDQHVHCDIDVRTQMTPRLITKYFADLVSPASEQSSLGMGPRFFPITGEVCEDWFGFAPSRNFYEFMEHGLGARARGRSLAEDHYLYHTTPSAEYESNTIADMLHRLLCDDQHGLDMRLLDQAEWLRGVYDDALAAGEKLRQDGWERVKQRYASPDLSDARNFDHQADHSNTEKK